MRICVAAGGLALASLLTLTVSRPGWAGDDDDDDENRKPVTELVVTAKRLDAARENIEPSLGASTYSLSAEMVENRPGSESTSINQVLLQAPGVMQDGSGQLRVRQSHGDLQYRINGVILPEGVSDLGESLSARIAQSIQLVTGALPAQYGFQAGGVVNVTTKSGAYLDGGQIEGYGGSHGEFEPAFEYGSNIGPTNMFFSGGFHRRNVGLAAPDGSARPLHDRSDETDGFAYLDHIVNDLTRVSLIAGLSDDRFQAPNFRGLDAGPFTVGGTRTYDSTLLNDRRREATRYIVGSVLRATERFTVQGAIYFRESVSNERADSIGDLIYKGLAFDSNELDDARGGQIEAVYKFADAHTLRGGVVGSWSHRKAGLRGLSLPANAQGLQVGDIPTSLFDTTSVSTRKVSTYLQDEWRATDALTVNAGVRFDDVHAIRHDSRLSPRINAVWSFPVDGLTLHAGYARYFLPAPVEGTASEPAELFGTTGAPPTLHGAGLLPETDDYYDVGVQWSRESLTIGIDGYWRQATNFIAEGQFGLANLTEPYNYATARVRGLEFSATYVEGPITAWSNLAIAEGRGRGIVSNQFFFTPTELIALAAQNTSLSHDETYTASAGASYRWHGFRVMADALYGSGLPRSLSDTSPNGAHLPSYTQINMALRYTFNPFPNRPLDIRLDIFNVADTRYRLRDGTGLGDGLPEWGPRRTFYVGFEQTF